MATRTTNRQSGFGALVVLAVVTVLVVAGGSSYVVYRHSHKSTSAAASSSPSVAPSPTPLTGTSTTPPAQTAPQYLGIKEWGVQIPLDNRTASLYYYIKPDLPNVAYLSLKTVSDIAPDCAANKVSLGAIYRLTEAEQASAVANPSVLNRPATVHLGNYWYGYDHPNSGCIADAAQSAAVSKVQPDDDLSPLLKKLQATAN